MRRVLVTGASGFVGANLVRALLSAGDEVHVLARPSHTRWRLVGLETSLQFHNVDLADGEAVMATIATVRPQVVFHLAAYGAYPHQRDTRTMVMTNTLGTSNLLDASVQADVETFVNTGSSSEYGEKLIAPTEREWLEPNSAYAVTKASATHFCRLAAQKSGMRAPTLRLYSVYGPYEEPARLLPTLAVHAMRGRLPPLVRPEIARDFVYVDDVIRAYLLAAGTCTSDPGKVYNVGTGVQTRLDEIVGLVRREMGIEVEPRWGSMPDRQWDTATWVADIRASQGSLQWAPRYSLAEGFARLVEWLRADAARLAFYAQAQGLV